MRQRGTFVSIVAGLVAVLGVGCGEDALVFVDARPPDAAEATDAMAIDAQTVDAGAVDATTLDAAMLDAPTVDAATLDAAMLDASEPDAATLDATEVDATLVDAAIDATPLDAPPQTFYWADWTAATTGAAGSASGTFTPPSGAVQITYSGEVAFAQLQGGTNFWIPGEPYINGVTANAPPTPDLIALNGVAAATYTVTFDRPVTGLVMAIISLGQPGLSIRYHFDHPIVLLSEGRGYWGDGTMTVENGDTIAGNEGHGAIQLTQPVSSISWTVIGSENWHGFTLGIPNQ